MTLHVRLTKACNADCSYCSSWQESPSNRMTPDLYLQSLNYIWDKWQNLGLNIDFLTIEYVGGEILLIPDKELEELVKSARKFFKDRGVIVRDGAQSNLIGSHRKLSHLFTLFDSRLGTSIDSITDKRTIKGSAEEYRVFFRSSENHLKANHGKVVPAVFTMDKSNSSMVGREIEMAEKSRRGLTIRPVFRGGIDDVDFIAPSDLSDILISTFNNWFMKSRINLEPHASLLSKWMSLSDGRDLNAQNDLCPFQNNCAKRSLSLEPNGDLYVCQEMADTDEYRLGNALFENWFEEAWDIVSARPEKLHSDCKSCRYLAVCQGGCMMQAIQDGNGPYGKPDYCESWKAIFSAIEKGLKDYQYEEVRLWLSRLYC